VTGAGAARSHHTAAALPALLAALLVAGCAGAPPPVVSDGNAEPTSVAPPASPRAGNAPFYEVHGSRYYVMARADDYRERGVASWYGRKFHGRPTASGETYDMHAMTAAHKTLPIPSYVRVRNLANDRQVIVRVNDRGPFVKNRLIDLSYEAARQLELIGPGTGLVEVVVIPDPTDTGSPAIAATASTATVEMADAGSGYREFYVQVGAYGDPANAQRMRTRLIGLGFDNVQIHASTPPEPAYRVRVGPFSDVSAYDAILERMRLADIEDTFLTGR
jgi:rare lipoprotein A